MISVMHSGRFSSKRQGHLFWCFTGKRSGGRVTKGRKALKASCIQMCASVFTFTIFKKKKMKITFQSSCLLRLQFAKKKNLLWGAWRWAILPNSAQHWALQHIWIRLQTISKKANNIHQGNMLINQYFSGSFILKNQIPWNLESHSYLSLCFFFLSTNML